MDRIPLNYEASEGDTHKQTTHTLPPEVVQCLTNARFLHLATCIDNVPNVSLMNYTYLATSPYSTAPVIVMTSNPASRKTTNIVANPNVSILVHDWISHRPSAHERRPSGGSPVPQPRSSLATFLFNLNLAELSSISAAIRGSARLAPTGTEEEKFYIDRHLENNTFEDSNPFQQANGSTNDRQSHFVAGEEVRVIVVEIKDVRISDYKGTVKDWALVPQEQLVNGSA
ncbi:hypothetical protein S7711_08773 [Stachybotrys chartarum IBT 7711]|uniref:Pyridoxamine 5'-phosphate oxidase N-terminal domain-containing protein n=1 Tax=Stachybotrys chartarum (strain CBS 109288 / IBT 7711) TaxID=1280523 RepID=A0A084AIV6_STACB|nr:hypothetical protein S7711_08773 [Stachybotrys chartarum IBT 7711]KFA47856.1 hypothetical protein S40293_06407 [Stachybotrys chartarum IBT 40293]KFA81002.1 hypothetical protein S40288_00778 [Stachybotrys chartarum IBT 40288]